MATPDCTPFQLAHLVESTIARLLADPTKNNLGPGHPEPAWGDFLVGYASGADELFAALKEVIGPFHWSPAEAFACAQGLDPRESHPARPAAPRGSAAPRGHSVAETKGASVATELSVISWALCQTTATKADNREETLMPSERWARSRMFGQEANVALHRELIALLAAYGHPAVAPSLSPRWQEVHAGSNQWASTWSERHVAHICGLGTFGLSGGLITTKGKAVRLGSLVVKASLPPTARAYSGPFDYCLYLTRGLCGLCAERCPVGSVTREGRDKPACSRHLRPRSEAYIRDRFGFVGYACGLCQTGVPCESGLPSVDSLPA